MDGQEYLNQISAEARPVKKGKGGRLGSLMASPIFKAVAIGVALLVVIIIVGAALGNGKGGLEKQATSLLLHINNTSAVVSNYQDSLKSSTLRSSSASLSSVLSNTSRDLTSYMTDNYKYKASSVDKALTESALLNKEGLESELFNAKINGILDRIYAHKMGYEVSLIMNETASVYNATSNDTLRNMMRTFYDSLGNLYTQFNDFSETK
ncbi:hypothetical protein IKG68_00765 [Candidatus Saccharibacteria bacterium]|nr:hypothetical protein [Candidatus Saccharibacteria bacterium]